MSCQTTFNTGLCHITYAFNRIYEINEYVESENAKLRELAAKTWSLFVTYGSVHACDWSEIDAVRNGLRELGIKVD